jgi:hypothetical protein
LSAKPTTRKPVDYVLTYEATDRGSNNVSKHTITIYTQNGMNGADVEKLMDDLKAKHNARHIVITGMWAL